MEKYYILTFINTHGAMNAESVLKQKNVRNVVMPTPTFITKSCGLSIKIDYESINTIQEMINLGNIKVKGIYLKADNGYSVISEDK